jgi:hypothetical protein
MIRVRAGISYALAEGMDEGHCGLPTEELIPLAEKMLEVPQELIGTALDLELREGTMVAGRSAKRPVYFWPVCIARLLESWLGFKFTLTMAAYDLIKLPRLIGVPA